MKILKIGSSLKAHAEEPQPLYFSPFWIDSNYKKHGYNSCLWRAFISQRYKLIFPYFDKLKPKA